MLKKSLLNSYFGYVILILITSSCCTLTAQNSVANKFRVTFYNTENFFDYTPDSAKNDYEFLPQAKRNWNTEKYQKKQNDIAQVITHFGKNEAPAIIGLCEIENANVLTTLINNSQLQRVNYQFIHHESPDIRGIDVALLYNPNLFTPISNKAIPVLLPNNETTRDILYVSGITPSNDTLHLFVCHFSSRSRGIAKTEPLRLHAASVLKSKTDSLLLSTPACNIIIMGDFNDYPDDNSIKEVLQAEPIPTHPKPEKLYNLSYLLFSKGKGNYKHRTKWVMMDQIIVSGNLLNSKSRFFTTSEDFFIFDNELLLENDDKYNGKKPFRTYVGIKYNGGYSDHLPVYTDFWYK